jgi:dienelactone hydrolase
MPALSRRDFLVLGLAASAGLAHGDEAPPSRPDLHQQLLALAARLQERRRARFTAVHSAADLAALQKDLRQKFLDLLDGLPAASGPPPVRKTGTIEADDYLVEKFVFESLPGYFVPALLYRPKAADAAAPGILSPCGHTNVGKAGDTYQTLHINLAKRGYVVLTYDPVGQGERSQFWDAGRGRSRFNLSCGEHAVLGNPLYLLGTSLARYRIWDGMRGLDYLASRPEVDARRLGCVGNSGGGTLTAYITALDPRVAAAVIGCYITTLPRRMGNRIQTDPDADPEQDIFDFVGADIDHAGLLALCAPRPTLLATARYDFFPIEGARESFAEAKKLYEAAGAGDRVGMVEAEEKHGLTLPLREAAYGWFDRWLGGRGDRPRTGEIPVKPRPPSELQVCADGQVNVTFRSRPLLPLALEESRKRPAGPRVPLKEVLRLDPDAADFRLAREPGGKADVPLLVCVNGNEAPGWEKEADFLRAVSGRLAVAVLEPRGVGALRPPLQVKGREYADPLDGVEENLAYNAFLVGKSLLGMRVSDVLAAVARLADKHPEVILCARRDAALVACLAAAVDPRVRRVAVEEMPLSFLPLFGAEGRPVNAASVLPRLLRDVGDLSEVLAAITPRRALVAAAGSGGKRLPPTVQVRATGFLGEPRVLLDWLGE